MKKVFTIISAILLTACAFAQAPQSMSYQAVIRDAENKTATNQNIGMQISILKDSIDGTAVYVERHFPSTNANGLVSLIIGGETATVVSGDFSKIDWAKGSFFIKTETDLLGGSSYIISGTSQLLSVPYAMHANTAGSVKETDPTVKKYKVGDFAKGGIVFWVDETGQHGLVCAKEDQSGGLRWHAGTSKNTHAKGDGLYAGKTNTAIIIAAHAAIGDDDAQYAARICNELQVTHDGTTYGDWYLPSMEELNQMHLQKSVIDATATLNGGTALNSNYWSSTELTDVSAGNLCFGSGVLCSGGFPSAKNTKYKVRAIRSF